MQSKLRCTAAFFTYRAHGFLRPALELKVAETASLREANAALHLLAAEVELATPEKEHWVAGIESLCDGGIVFLELDSGSIAEFARAKAMLVEISRKRASSVRVEGKS